MTAVLVVVRQGPIKPNATILESVLSMMVDECVIWALSERHDVEACATKYTALACGSGCD